MNLEEVSRAWRPPDGLGYSSLRPVRLSLAGIALTVLAAAILPGGLLLGSLLWTESRRQETQRQALAASGVAAQATVVELYRSNSKDHKRHVRYRFSVDGNVYTASPAAPPEIWGALKAGDPIEVRYVAGDPSISHPVQWEAEVTPLFLAPLMPLMLWAATGLMGYTILRQWRLLSAGRPAPGVVTSVRRAGKRIQVHYDFRLPDGAIRQGRVNQRRSGKPAEGSVICVLYEADNPRRSQIYPLSLVRLG